MSETRDYRELADRLKEERDRLENARTNYETITRSRFHALRMLWFSLKHLVGRASPHDVYAVWSQGSAAQVPPGRIARPEGSATVSVAESALIEAWNRRIAAREPQAPLVTVVIPVYNHRAVTARCLQSIAASWFEWLPVQFVIVDDGSTDETANLITKLHGVDYLRNARNEGFVHACNRGAMLAQGKYICFLNNDTAVRDGWLDHLVSTAEADQSIGVVGSKLLYPNGRLQEAGAIIWRDATGWNVGRNENPADPRYNYLRDVDYVSGAALLIARDVFFKAGGFSDLFRPAYYEDADLCFKVRELDMRVVYQPRSEVVHFESMSSGNERTGVKRFQEINRPKFREKWSARLERHLQNDRSNVLAASLPNNTGKTILIIDSHVPMHDRDAGSRRMFHIVKMLRSEGHNVLFLPDNYAAAEPYTTELQQIGVQVLYHVDGGPTQLEALEQILPVITHAWISRPELYKKYAALVRRNRGARVIYDTVDLHHIRMQREAQIAGSAASDWREWEQLESEAARTSDATVVVTPEEREVIVGLGAQHIFVVPTIHEPANVPLRRYEDTSGLLFVGNYNHPPNVDAAQWLCNSVMPIVWNHLPEVRLALVGSNPSDAVRALKSDRVSVSGYVPNLESFYRNSRIFVAPLRYGAGMKGKIGQALEYALPIITTPVGAEGFRLRDGENAVIADVDPQALADAIVALYQDESGWRRLSAASPATLRPFTCEAVLPELQSLLLGEFGVEAQLR